MEASVRRIVHHAGELDVEQMVYVSISVPQGGRTLTQTVQYHVQKESMEPTVKVLVQKTVEMKHVTQCSVSAQKAVLMMIKKVHIAIHVLGKNLHRVLVHFAPIVRTMNARAQEIHATILAPQVGKGIFVQHVGMHYGVFVVKIDVLISVKQSTVNKKLETASAVKKVPMGTNASTLAAQVAAAMAVIKKVAIV